MKKTDYRIVVTKLPLDDEGEEIRVTSFGVEHPSEVLAMLEFCMQNDVEWWVRDDDEKISEKAIEAMDMGGYVDSYYVSFGSDDVLQTIEVYLK